MNEETLVEKLRSGAQQAAIGSIYTHYKGGLYVVKTLGIEESTDEVSVVYEACYGEKLTFIRSLSSWTETVEVNDTKIRRFTKKDQQTV